ncbi:MAG: hypothetical protein RQ757_00185 [Pseudomonadales bacterium]|nr:hypothetical protein [Pseudomonadales bacterium]
MSIRLKSVPSILALLALLLSVPPALAADNSIPRTADGRPDFNGIWQAMGTAHYNLEPHAAGFPPAPELGAFGAIPAGLGVVVGGEIPYRPQARAQQQANQADWLARDPVVKCYLPGVPRANYMPFPFQIVQSPETLVMAYEFASAMRIVYMNQAEFKAPVPSWMGHSLGSWEGDTLVIEVTEQMPDSWFDHAGNFHSESLRVVERYTHLSADVLQYEARIEDPEVFTEAWTLRMPLYRRLDQNMQLLEFKCVEFTEELIYGHLSKGAEHQPGTGSNTTPDTGTQP